MSLSFCQLDLDERRRIDRMHQKRISVTDIAQAVGGYRSIIYRELRRNRFIGREVPELNGYYCVTAQDKALGRRNKLLVV